jgi:hypothetical protein
MFPWPPAAPPPEREPTRADHSLRDPSAISAPADDPERDLAGSLERRSLAQSPRHTPMSRAVWIQG